MRIHTFIIFTFALSFVGDFAIGQNKPQRSNQSETSSDAGKRSDAHKKPQKISKLRKNEFGKGGSKHRKAQKNIASLVMSDSNQTVLHADEYSADLADILGQLDSDALNRVLGSKINLIE